jgi:late competence protein required for DNA uptake (superfamily II DNA/RNA helicase)
LRSVCSSLHTWLLSTGKCDLGSCIIFIAKTVFHCLEWWKLVWNIPINRRTKCNCPHGPSSNRNAEGTKFVPVMFYCGDCMWLCRSSQYQHLKAKYFKHTSPRKKWTGKQTTAFIKLKFL